MGFDSNFELKFSQLVDSRLQEKVPSLYPSRVGFQLIDVNDAQDMGVGVMAFIVNGAWMYAPSFFIKGQLKGMDLLYIKNNDIFVPLRDNWISFLQKNEVKRIGTSVDKSEVKSQKPNMINLVLSPHEKISVEQNSLIDYETLGKMMTKMAEYERDLVSEIPKLGKVAFECFVSTMAANPDFANAILKFYTPADMKKIAADLDAKSIDGVADRKSTATDPDKESDSKADEADNVLTKAVVESMENTNPKVNAKVVIETEVSEPSDASVSDAKGATVAVPEFAEDKGKKVPQTQQELVVITSPSCPLAEGLSEKEKEILIRDGIFIKDNRTSTTSVFNADLNMSKFSNPKDSGFYEVLLRDGTCIPMLIVFPNLLKEDDGPISYCRPRSVLPENKAAVIDPKTPEKCWMVDVKDLMTAPAAKLPDDLYSKISNLPEMTKTKMVEGKNYKRLLLVDRKRNAAVVNYNVYGGQQILSDTIGKLRFTGKDGKMYRSKGLLYIPNGTVAFEIESSIPYQLGDVNTFAYHLRKTAGLGYLKVYSDRGGYAITSDKGQKFSLSKKAALLNLVQTQGIFTSLAKKMLKEASDKSGLPASRKYFLKYADMYDLNAGDPRGTAGTTPQAPLESEYTLMPARALETASQASAQGVKEVLDTSVLAALAGTSHSLELMGTYLADMIKAMDKVGRLLFLFYWHQDEFREQYGMQELVELEESLRSVFSATGDLILFLKEKSVDFDSLFSGNRDNIADDIGGGD